MPRGQTSEVGAQRESANGYRYTKTHDRGWVLDHWLVWEEFAGRKVNPTKETIRFRDGNKHNMEPTNLTAIPKGTATLRKREAELMAKIKDYQDELAYVQKQLSASSQ